jgi:hypothetical protein
MPHWGSAAPPRRSEALIDINFVAVAGQNATLSGDALRVVLPGLLVSSVRLERDQYNHTFPAKNWHVILASSVDQRVQQTVYKDCP